jgi:hypothetical protein
LFVTKKNPKNAKNVNDSCFYNGKQLTTVAVDFLLNNFYAISFENSTLTAKVKYPKQKVLLSLSVFAELVFSLWKRWKITHLTTVKKQFGHIQRTTCLGMTGCMSTTPTAAMKTLLDLPPLQLVVEKEVRQAAYRLHCSNHFKWSDWGHSAIFKIATEDFPVLLAPSGSMLPLEVFDRKDLVEYPFREIWLTEAEAWLPSDGLKFYTDGSLFEGRAGSGVSLEELDLKASFTLETFGTVFQAEV